MVRDRKNAAGRHGRARASALLPRESSEKSAPTVKSSCLWKREGADSAALSAHRHERAFGERIRSRPEAWVSGVESAPGGRAASSIHCRRVLILCGGSA